MPINALIKLDITVSGLFYKLVKFYELIYSLFFFKMRKNLLEKP